MQHTWQTNCRRLKQAIARPEVRRSFHYECGIYRDNASASPLVSLRMAHRARTPLWRMIAIASAMTLVILFVRSCIRRLPLGKRATHAHE